MTSLPTKSHLTSGTTSEADFQSAIGQLYDFIEQIALSGPAEALTLDASGVVVPTKSITILDTFAAAATDNLDLITPSSIGEKVILIRGTSAARVITVRHNQSGTGKIWLNGAVNAVLYDPTYCIALMWNAANSRWEEIFRNFGLYVTQVAEKTAIKTLLGLGTASALDYGTSSGQLPRNSDLGNASLRTVGTSTGQLPLADAFGALAWLSAVTDAYLTNTGVTAGTYGRVTVNAQGRVTAGSEETVASGNVVGCVRASSTAYAAYTIPSSITEDDTTPTPSEMVAILAATASLTCVSTGNFLRLQGQVPFATNASGRRLTLAVFRDSETVPIWIGSTLDMSNGSMWTHGFFAEIPVADISAHTYRLYGGGNGDFTVNGYSGSRVWGGKQLCCLTVSEIKG